jgi:hypothetical protein
MLVAALASGTKVQAGKRQALIKRHTTVLQTLLVKAHHTTTYSPA